MSTAPAPVTGSAGTTTVTSGPKKENKFESFFTKFGHVLEDIGNGATNIAVEELPDVEPLLPPALGSAVAKVVTFAAQQVAAVDAKYAAIGASDVSYGVKVAEAVAVGGVGAIAIAAQAGFTLPESQLGVFFSGAGQIASALNLSNITESPAPPAAPANTTAA